MRTSCPATPIAGCLGTTRKRSLPPPRHPPLANSQPISPSHRHVKEVFHACRKDTDDGAWSIPKGEPEPDEDLLLTAQREFEEETGLKPTGPFIPLKPIQQKGGKIVHAWAFEGDCDPATLKSNTFTMEWPPHSGRQQEFPEIDRAEFYDMATARKKIKAGQEALIEELEMIVESK